LFRLFSKVAVEPKWLDRVKEQAEDGTVVHVSEVEGLLDFALLNYLFLKHRIPVVKATNVRLNILLKPLLFLLFYPVVFLLRLFRKTDRVGAFCREIAAGGAGLLFLKRARFVMLPGGNIGLEYLEGLVRQQRAQAKPIILIPQVIFWHKGPEKYKRSLLDLLLGDPNAPGPRRLMTFILRPSRVHVTCGEPVNVKEVMADATNPGDNAIARKLNWHLHRSFDRTEKVTRGPMLKNAAQIRNEMMFNPDFVGGVEEIGGRMGLKPKSARRRAVRNIMEIAADFGALYIEALSIFLTPVFRRVFSSFVVDRDAIHTIREASKDSAVVLVPCHRSHIDYLVISYLMYLHGLIPPHIAAGANLSFFPLGHIFRHCGAFFIRRKIGGDQIYSYVLAQYIRKLLKEGHSVEFFIEGGRSRTGKTLPPKFGLLSFVAEAVVGEAVRAVTIIPISLSYERIMEAEGYALELTGKGDKRREDLAGLVRSAEVLDSRYGRLYLTAGRPIKVADFFEKTMGKPCRELDDEEKRYLVKRLGYLILGRINRATVINPSGLVATVLLSHHRRGISKPKFLETAGFLLYFGVKRGYPISVTLDRALKAAIHFVARSRERADKENEPRLPNAAIGEAVAPILDEAVEMFGSQGHVASEEYDDGQVLSVHPTARIFLNYYRNNIIHVYQREALVALSIFARKNRGDINISHVEKDVQFFSRLFKREFIFRIGDFEQGIQAGIAALEKHCVVRNDGNGCIVPVPENLDRLRLFRNMVLPIVESYLICARYASIVRWKGAMRPKDLARAILARASKDYGEGEVTCQEALSTVNILNALDRYISMDLLKTVESGIDAGKIRFSKGSALEDLAEIDRKLALFVDVT